MAAVAPEDVIDENAAAPRAAMAAAAPEDVIDENAAAPRAAMAAVAAAPPPAAAAATAPQGGRTITAHTIPLPPPREGSHLVVYLKPPSLAVDGKDVRRRDNLHLVHLVNAFGERGGFQSVIQAINVAESVATLMLYVETCCDMHHMLSFPFVVSFAPAFIRTACCNFLRLSHDLDCKSIRRIIRSLNRLAFRVDPFESGITQCHADLHVFGVESVMRQSSAGCLLPEIRHIVFDYYYEPSSYGKTWQCPLCTLQNEAHREQCETCLGPNPSHAPQKSTKAGRSDSEASDSEREAGGSDREASDSEREAGGSDREASDSEREADLTQSRSRTPEVVSDSEIPMSMCDRCFRQ
jgi:hypothetical protein